MSMTPRAARPAPAGRRPRRDRRARGLAAAGAALLAVLAAGGLSACGPEQVGTAAVVGDERIRVDQLQDQTQELLAAVPGTDPGQAQTSILQSMILSDVIAEAAGDLDVAVSRGEAAAQRDQLLAQVRQQAQDKDKPARVLAAEQLAQQQIYVAPSELDAWVRDQLLLREISAAAAEGLPAGSQEAADATTKALVAASRRLDVDVNPRYGRWNPEQGLEASVGGGLSKTVAELTKPTGG